MNEVEALLRQLGLERFAPQFLKHEITKDELPSLTEDDLVELGITDAAERSRFLLAVTGPVDRGGDEILRSHLTSSPGSTAFVAPTPAVSTSSDQQFDALSGRTSFAAPAPVLEALSPPLDPLLAGTAFVPQQGPSSSTIGGSASTSPLEPSSTRHPSGTQDAPATSSSPPGAAPLRPTAEVRTEVGVGQKLKGRYYLAKELGRGAMGVVYKAVDEVTRMDVAVKLIVPELVGSREVIDLMLKEAALAQELTHENLLRINHVEGGDQPFIVMELIDGDTLTSIWEDQKRRLEEPELRRILLQVLNGLAYLHERKLVHRDVKPDNVMVSKTGEVKLTDYGVATTLREQRQGATQAGTLLYMAPEQLRGEPCDGQADLYAVGIMGHQLLTGQFPFEAGTAEQVRAWHLASERATPLLSGSAMEGVLRKAMASDRGARYGSAREMADSLNSASGSSDEHTADSRTSSLGSAAAVSSHPFKPSVRWNLESSPVSSAPLGAQPAMSTAPDGQPTSAIDLLDKKEGRGLLVAAAFVLIVPAVVGIVMKFGLNPEQTGRPPSEQGVSTSTDSPAPDGNAAKQAPEPNTTKGANDREPELDPGETRRIASLPVSPPPPPRFGVEGTDWIRFDAGQAWIGCESSEDPTLSCFSDEGSASIQHYSPFWLMRTEVTVAQYRACLRDGSCVRPKSGKGCNFGVKGRDMHPVNCVTWSMADTFCRAAGGRLPSAEEWESAAKGDRRWIFPWGDELPGDGHVNLCDRKCPRLDRADERLLPRRRRVQAHLDDGHSMTAPVGSYPAGNTPEGLADMAGNVWEWTSSSWRNKKERRGGSFIDRPRALRLSNRFGASPESFSNHTGFRCAW